MKKLGEFLGDVFACCFWGVVALLAILLVAAAKNGFIAFFS